MDLEIQYQYRKDDVTKSSPTGERFKASDIDQIRQKLEILPETAQITIKPYSPSRNIVLHHIRLKTVLQWKELINEYVNKGYTWSEAFFNAFAASGYTTNSNDEDEIPFIPDDTEYFLVYCRY